ncbi:hypothetical protein PAXRUDRAFT_391306 [Paxillus rubicundulus Ve08.2h10]|uniref:Uncharacterized protein n=1 Tax=Paxillus rubicundulus Ve08.2h10 TaxID=930991 RepID=A0A0D0D9N0_9AGAM|nr:hypothetical protein PAXRUDRAFT_391306 [Paxillus rubicundulus Ve08.2h10]
MVDLDSDEEDECSDSEDALEKSSLHGDFSTINPTKSTSISVSSGSPLIPTTSTTTTSTNSSTSPSISDETIFSLYSFYHFFNS